MSLMNYYKSESLKFKRSVFNKLVWISSLATIFIVFFLVGIQVFQPFGFYWWYSFILPGFIALSAMLSQQKEEKSGNYNLIISSAVDLKKVWLAKNLIIMRNIIIAHILIAVLISSEYLFAPNFIKYSFLHALGGSMIIALASIWQIPICLFACKYLGKFIVVFANLILALFVPVFVGKTAFWFLFPHCWIAKSVEPILGIAINGTSMENITFSLYAPVIAVVLSVVLFLVVNYLGAKKFAKQN